MVPVAGDAAPDGPGWHAVWVGHARGRMGDDDRPGHDASRGPAARVGRRRVVVRPDAATSRLHDGQVVHGPDRRRTVPPDRIAEQRFRRLSISRSRQEPDPIGRGSASRCTPITPRAFATISRQSTRPTSRAPSTCSRMASTRCRNASTPSSKRSSGTSATPGATSHHSQCSTDIGHETRCHLCERRDDR